MEIKELSRINAARLLMIVAGQYENLKKFKTASELSHHKIFDMISYKPVGIIQMASLIAEKTLD